MLEGLLRTVAVVAGAIVLLGFALSRDASEQTAAAIAGGRA